MDTGISVSRKAKTILECMPRDVIGEISKICSPRIHINLAQEYDDGMQMMVYKIYIQMGAYMKWNMKFLIHKSEYFLSTVYIRTYNEDSNYSSDVKVSHTSDIQRFTKQYETDNILDIIPGIAIRDTEIVIPTKNGGNMRLTIAHFDDRSIKRFKTALIELLSVFH